jgi:hypothetical protein
MECECKHAGLSARLRKTSSYASVTGSIRVGLRQKEAAEEDR